MIFYTYLHYSMSCQNRESLHFQGKPRNGAFHPGELGPLMTRERMKKTRRNGRFCVFFFPFSFFSTGTYVYFALSRNTSYSLKDEVTAAASSPFHPHPSPLSRAFTESLSLVVALLSSPSCLLPCLHPIPPLSQSPTTDVIGHRSDPTLQPLSSLPPTQM